METLLSFILLLVFSSVARSDTRSCAGRCGQGYYRGSVCQCDDECLSLNECCSDFQTLCTSKESCKGRCGELYYRGNLCHCDSDCGTFSQCCSDHDSTCLVEDASDEDLSFREGFGEELATPEEDEADAPPESSGTGSTSGPQHQTRAPGGGEMLLEIFTSVLPAVEMRRSSTPHAQEETTEGSSPLPPKPTEDSMSPFSNSPSEEEESTRPGEPSETNPTLASTDPPPETPTTSNSPVQTMPTEDPTSTMPTIDPMTIGTSEDPTTIRTSEDPTTTFEDSTTIRTSEDPSTIGTSEGPTMIRTSEDPTIAFEDRTTIGMSEDTTTIGTSESPTTIRTSEDPTTASEDQTTIGTSEDTTTIGTSEDPITASEDQTTIETSEDTTTIGTSEDPITASEDRTTLGTSEDPMTKGTSADPTSTRATEDLASTRPSTAPASTVAPVAPEAPSSPRAESSISRTTAPGEEPADSPLEAPSTSLSQRNEASSVRPAERHWSEVDNRADGQSEPDLHHPDEHDQDLCSGRAVSGLTTLKNGTTVVFRGHYFWTLDRDRKASAPRLISEGWGLPSPIDTVYTRCNCQGKTYFIKGGWYWRFEDGVMDGGFPRPLTQGFGRISHVTAALSVPRYRSRPETVLFFRRGGLAQTYTYQVTPSCGGGATRSYRHAVRGALGPLVRVSRWRGFPATVTSAVSLPSRVKEGYKYYVFTPRSYYSIKMEREKPVIVRHSSGLREKPATSFFNCPEAGQEAGHP